MSDALKRARNMTCTCVNNGDYCESCQIKQGCGKRMHVEGTNGGTMPCGAFLTVFGTRTRQYCADCDSRTVDTIVQSNFLV